MTHDLLAAAPRRAAAPAYRGPLNLARALKMLASTIAVLGVLAAPALSGSAQEITLTGRAGVAVVVGGAALVVAAMALFLAYVLTLLVGIAAGVNADARREG